MVLVYSSLRGREQCDSWIIGHFKASIWDSHALKNMQFHTAQNLKDILPNWNHKFIYFLMICALLIMFLKCKEVFVFSKVRTHESNLHATEYIL